MKNIGIYVHIPFCRSKCLYCDFCSHPPREGEKDKYISQLKAHIASYRDRFSGYVADTVYFGGGTPTLLSPGEIGGILDAVRDTVSIDKNAEITVECNPATASKSAFEQLRAAGVNRISIGAQSLNDKELKALGRLHTAEQFVATFKHARKAGFDNISLDLMYGIPYQTRESWAATLDTALSLAPRHVSAYGLRVEQGTPFGNMGDALVLPDEDDVAQMYLDAVKTLESRGILRYEISNFACQGSESRHNIKYWKRDEYVGFGVAAHSFFEGKRYAAPQSFERYASGEWLDADSITDVSEADAEVEFVMLAMRLRDGVDREAYRARFGCYPDEKYAPRIRQYVDGGYIVSDGRGFRFNDEGMLVSNSILASILDV